MYEIPDNDCMMFLFELMANNFLMLVNWFCSAFTEGHYLQYVLSKQDLKIIGVQFCTHLLACGVIRQLEDDHAPRTGDPLFRPDRMYCWAHTEAPMVDTPLPGKLS